MRSELERAYRVVTKILPPFLAAHLDGARESFRGSWGGPMNGQAFRQDIVREIVRLVPVEAVVETGTFRGTTTEFLAYLTGSPVYTVESQEREFLYSRRRLAPLQQVVLQRDDSRSFLASLSEDLAVCQATTLFYLDAHWENNLPLADELKIIAEHWQEAVVVIDDFEVPGDPHYLFDDYGPGKRLTASYLPYESLHGWSTFYPSRPGCEETGMRRGCAVLATPNVATALGAAHCLRRA